MVAKFQGAGVINHRKYTGPVVNFAFVVLPVLPAAILTVCFAVPAAVAQDVASSIEVAEVQAAEMVEAFVAAGGSPGVAVSVGHNGAIIWNSGFGFADLEQRVPVSPEDTKFRVGSIAKPLTALAVAQLRELGALDLDAPVQTYVPSFPEKRGTVTTRLLAGHLAGIRHYRGDEFLSQQHYDTVVDGLAIFAADTLLFEPGSDYSYSTYGWNLISAVVEGASRRSFLEYTADHVFEPLGLDDTVADQVGDIIPGRSRFYEVDPYVDGSFRNSPPVDNSNKWAGGGFLSTSDDLVRFGFAHLEPVTISSETVAMLWESQQTTSGEKTDYGIGWGSGVDEDGRRYAAHTGGSVGGTTWFRVYPDQQLVVAVIGNVSSADWEELPARVADLFLDAVSGSGDE